MPEVDFSGCWAKMKRGGYHSDTLADYFATTFAAQPNSPTVGITFKPDTGEHVVYISHMPNYQDVLLDISSVVGDAVHNFRSALNLLAFQLALRNTNGQITNERRVQFPIEDRVETFDMRCAAASDKDTQAWIGELSAVDQGAIRDFQPCLSDEDGQYLGLIRDVNDADKHRVLVRVGITANYIHGADDRLGAIAGAFFQKHGLDALLSQVIAPELGAELYGAVIPDWPETNVQMAGYVIPMLTFSDIGKAPRPYLVGKSLSLMNYTVGNILNKFSPPPSDWGVSDGPHNPPPPYPYPSVRSAGDNGSVERPPPDFHFK